MSSVIGAGTTCTDATVKDCVFGASCKDTANAGTFLCECDAGFTKNANDKICGKSLKFFVCIPAYAT